MIDPRYVDDLEKIIVRLNAELEEAKVERDLERLRKEWILDCSAFIDVHGFLEWFGKDGRPLRERIIGGDTNGAIDRARKGGE